MSMRDKDTHREKKRMLRIESFALLSKAQLAAPALGQKAPEGAGGPKLPRWSS